MAVDFKTKDFFYPLSLLKLRAFLEKSQWFTDGQLKEWQLTKMKIIIDHAYNNVPYYRKLFDAQKLTPKDFNSLDDLKKIPTLDKRKIKDNFKSLTARNARKFLPSLSKTSGSTGEPVEFYLDKPSRILEFCYYWRYWSWAGYRLGMPFAEFTLSHFLDKGVKDLYDYSRLTKRLMLNPVQLSYENMDKFISIIKRYRPMFLKGTPSSVATFAHLLKSRGNNDIKFHAVFTTGELLSPHHRKTIENTFYCKVFDSYGHMERTVAICQCQMGKYHINSDYGILEIEEDKRLSSDTIVAGRVIGTSLYNFAMPFIRYRVDDIVEVNRGKVRCECARGLPLCEKIAGRRQDIIVTPDGRMLSNIFILLDILEGALWAQIIQESSNRLRIKIIKGDNFSGSSEQEFIRQLSLMVGDAVKIDTEYVSRDALETLSAQKYKPVISHLKYG